MKRVLCLAVVGLALGWSTALAQRFADVEVKSTHVAGNVHMLTGAGGNIGVSVGDDGILMVDDQFLELADRIRAALGELGDGELEFLFNTHWHGDHTGGNPVFGPDVPIIAHTNVRKRLSSSNKVRGRVVEPMAEAGLPVITFDKSLSVHFNGEEIKALHLPNGHTDGDTLLFFTGSNVVHMGDTFFAGRFPFVDRENGGSVVGLAANVATVLGQVPADAKIIPGHGDLSTVDDLKAYHRMLDETIEIVRAWVAEGVSLDDAKATGFPEEYDRWGTGFISEEVWIETIHGELSN